MDEEGGEELTYAERKARYLARFATLPFDEQQRHILVLIRAILDLIAKKQPEPEPTHPEDVDADDQDAIDAAFNDLMDGVL